MDFDYTPDQIQLRKDYRERLEAVMTPNGGLRWPD